MPWQTRETEPWNHEQNPYSGDRARRGQASNPPIAQKRILAGKKSDVEPIEKSTIPPTPAPFPHPRILLLLSSRYVFSHSLTMSTFSFPSFVRQPPQSPLSGGLLRANGSADQGVGLASPQSPLSGGLLRAPLIRGARGVHLLRHPPAERPLRQIRSHEKKRRRQSSGTKLALLSEIPLL